jgi:hypothetical protein
MMPDEVELAVDACRTQLGVGERSTLEGREVLAGEISDEVGGGEDGLAVDELHR